MEEKEKYDVKDILKMAKYSFGLDTYSYPLSEDDDERIKRNIQRYTKKNVTPISVKGRTKYYSLKQVEQILYSDEGLHKYFVSLAKESATKEFEVRLKSDKEYDHLANEEMQNNSLDLFDRLEKLELNISNFLELVDDDLHDKMFLTIEELEFLDKKGLVLRDSLTENEFDSLMFYYEREKEEKEITSRIKEMFPQKKLEIMITALFNEKFKLDEDLLLSDISNSCWSVTYPIPEPEMFRSMDRLKDFRYYCQPRKKSDDHDEE